jgi:four helix bundle protein
MVVSEKYGDWRRSTAVTQKYRRLTPKYGSCRMSTLLRKSVARVGFWIAHTTMAEIAVDRCFCELPPPLREKRRDLNGRAFALGSGVPVSRVEDFAAYDFAVRFKLEVYRLIRESSGALKNFKYREQLEDAASGIEGAMSEGFGRGRPKEFALYLRYSLGSLNEAKTRLQDGVDCGYFRQAACEPAFTWAERCRVTTRALWRSQERKAAEEEQRKRSTKDKNRQVRRQEPRSTESKSAELRQSEPGEYKGEPRNQEPEAS